MAGRHLERSRCCLRALRDRASGGTLGGGHVGSVPSSLGGAGPHSRPGEGGGRRGEELRFSYITVNVHVHSCVWVLPDTYYE